MRRKFVVWTLVLAVSLGLMAQCTRALFLDCDASYASKSDQALIVLALMHIARGGHGRIGIGGAESQARAFLREHPRCCDVSRHSSNPVFTFLFGAPDVEVHMIYPIMDLQSGKSDGWYYSTYLIMSPCGHGYDEFGESISPRDIANMWPDGPP